MSGFALTVPKLMCVNILLRQQIKEKPFPALFFDVNVKRVSISKSCRVIGLFSARSELWPLLHEVHNHLFGWTFRLKIIKITENLRKQRIRILNFARVYTLHLSISQCPGKRKRCLYLKKTNSVMQYSEPLLSGLLRDLPKCPLNRGCKNCAMFVNDQHLTVTLYCDKVACC